LNTPTAEPYPLFASHCLREIESNHFSSNLGSALSKKPSTCTHIQNCVAWQDFSRCENCVPNLVTIEALSEDVPTSRNLSEVLLSFPRHVPRRYNRWNQVNERILRISYRGWRLMAKIDRYRVVARFARLFPDPAIFEDQDHLVERYLVQTGLPREKAIYLYQNEDEIIPDDDSGKPPVALGTASYRFQGKYIVAQLKPNASIALAYKDFATGPPPEDHVTMRKK